MENKMKITKDNFVWKILTLEETKLIFGSDVFELFILNDDDTETLIEFSSEINTAFKKGLLVGIEVGKFEININVK